MPNPKWPHRLMTEDTVIYYCQSRHSVEAMQAKVDARLAEGYEYIAHIEGESEKFRGIVLYPTRHFGGDYREFADARLVAETYDAQAEVTGRIKAVLPKGRRTNGVRVDGRAVLVLR
jgi:hypothetical protein